MTTASEGGEGSASRLGRSLPPGKTRYPLYRRLGGPQGRSEQVRKISSHPGFDPRIVQPAASRYTDCTTRPTITVCALMIKRTLPFLGIIRNLDNASKRNSIFCMLTWLNCLHCRKLSCQHKIPYFSIDNAHLMYNAHPKLFRHSFWCIDNAHDAN
jgi:hypothetical protein